MNRLKTTIGAIVVVFVTAAIVFAHSDFSGHMRGYGSGYDGHMMGPSMMGYNAYDGHMMGSGPWTNRGYDTDLSDEEIAKLDAAREQFFMDTRDLRNQIEDKQFSLQNELGKDSPNATIVTQLQKELSKLEGELDQKSVQYELEVRKIVPGKAFGYGYIHGFRNRECW